MQRYQFAKYILGEYLFSLEDTKGLYEKNLISAQFKPTSLKKAVTEITAFTIFLPFIRKSTPH